MTFTDNAIRLYITSSEQEKWAIRHFLTANSEDVSTADFLINVDGYLSRRAEAISEEKTKYFKIKPVYEKYVEYTDQRAVL
jgi:hypothetical protein